MFRMYAAAVLVTSGLYLAVLGLGEAPERGVMERRLVESSPFASSEARADLRTYMALRPGKAFAASVSRNSWGWSHGYGDPEEAARAALAYCEERGEKCLLYAVGERTVWDPDLAEREFAAAVSTTAARGAVWRFYGEENPHGLDLHLPPEAPSIVSDYNSARGVLGGLRAIGGDIPPRHGGIDIIGPLGAPVLAAAPGVVSYTGFEDVAGAVVRIDHGDGSRGGPASTEYIHLDTILVEQGETVGRGRQIGTIGVTGRGTTPERPHLHFSVPGANPHDFWRDGPGRVTCYRPGQRDDDAVPALTYPVPCGTPENIAVTAAPAEG